MNLQNRANYILIGVIAIVVAYMIGLSVGRGGSSESQASSRLTDLNTVTKDQFDPYWRVWQLLNDKYVAAGSTTPQEKIYGSIEGLASSYGDPYTVFFPPAESKMFNDDIAGDFEGVGMEIGIKDKQMVVVSPIKDSPAYKAGVKTGDYILSIDGKSTTDLPVDQAVKLIRGKKGTAVKIIFFTKGSAKPVERSLIRDIINIPTIDSSEKPGGVYLIQLYSFTATSPDLFRNALRQFAVSGDHKLILDLRGNPGGYLDAAWDMASWFLPAGDTVVTEDFGKNGTPRVFRSKGYNVFGKDLDMMILADGGSASAAEILAGALQENGVAKIVGSKTFGKGSVQELISVTPDTSLKVTVARWLTPKGHNLSHDGIDPDYPVEAATSTSAIADKKDPVMDKALQLLGNMQ